MTSIRPFVLAAVLMVSLAGLAQACPNSKAAAAMGCPASSCGNASTTTAAAAAPKPTVVTASAQGCSKVCTPSAGCPYTGGAKTSSGKTSVKPRAKTSATTVASRTN